MAVQAWKYVEENKLCMIIPTGCLIPILASYGRHWTDNLLAEYSNKSTLDVLGHSQPAIISRWREILSAFKQIPNHNRGCRKGSTGREDWRGLDKKERSELGSVDGI